MLDFTIQNRLQDGTSKVSEAAGARWRFYRRMWSDCRRMWSDCRRMCRMSSGIIVESSFYWRKHSGSYRWNLELLDFVAGALFGEVAGWLLLGPHIGNDVLYVTQIRNDIHFAWPAHYLVRLQGDFTCSRHWKWRFICDAEQAWHSFCVAGAVFGDVGGWLYLLHALEMTFYMWHRSVMTFILRGRRSIWWGCRVILLATRIGNDVSYVTQISDDIHFAWQAQYLVKLDGDSCYVPHCKWRFKVDRWG